MRLDPPRLLEPVIRPPDLRLRLPGSKSYANRALICAALTQAPISLSDLPAADDTALMLNVLADLGWRISRSSALSTEVRLTPPFKPQPAHEVELFTGNAGTATRFTLALLTVLPGRFRLDGSARMRERPMAELIEALRQLGGRMDELGEAGRLPLFVQGASLHGGRCVIRGDVSSQFVSALLLVAPARGIEIEVEGELVSRPYVDMTLDVMRAFGVAVERDGYRRFCVQPGSYARATNAGYACPPDATAGGYFWAAAAVTGGRCVIDGLTGQDAQPDVQLIGILERMGCRVLAFPDGLGVQGPACGNLQAVEADMSEMPDSAQTLAVLCAFARGRSRLTGLGTLRAKETDRIAALQSELSKIGAATRSGEDWLEVEGANNGGSEPLIHTFEDHRMAMSFAIAGLRRPVRIQNPACVSKSQPMFWDLWQKLYDHG